MHLHKTINEYHSWRSTVPSGESIGLVPTMGALHQGHFALIREAVRDNHHSVVTIFINPAQFNSVDDLEKYPQTLDEDLANCRELGVTAVFAPERPEMYPPGHAAYCQVEGLDQHLCGASRPGHFKGVCTIVLKLFNIMRAQRAYFGKKDFQQARIIQCMAKDLNLNIDIFLIDTVREPSGLAVSSRNIHLSQGEKERALGIIRGLRISADLFSRGERQSAHLIEEARREILSSSPDRIDYIALVSQETLQPVDVVGEPVVLAAAVFYGATRLIDNVLLEPQ